MDGTLIDSMPGLTDLAVEVIYEHFHLNKELARREYLRTAGLPFNEQLEKIFPGSRSSRVVAESVYLKRKREITLKAPSFHEVMKKLIAHHQAGDITALVSSTTHALVYETLVAHSVYSFFTYVYGYAEGNPKEEQIQHLIDSEHWNEGPYPDILYYGDTDEDLRIAKILNLKFYRVDKDGRIES